MSSRALRGCSVVLLGAIVSGCGLGSLVLPRPFALSRAGLDWAEVTAGTRPRFLPWAAAEPYVIIVDKGRRSLALFDRGREVKTYPVVLGRRSGRKLFEGDRRTPSGVYRVTAKRRHHRYHRFLDFDYPNHEDLENYRRALSRGDVPRAGERVLNPGRLLGIHGSDKEDLNRVGVNWTFGCVALLNRDVEELYETVPEGTLVLIHDGADGHGSPGAP